MKIPKEVIKEYVKSENFTNTTDIMESIKSMFADVLNEVLQCEMDEQLGYNKHERTESGEEKKNYRNGSTKRKMKTQLGEVEISVPRDRNGEYEPKIISKYQRNADGLEEKILSLYAHGMSTRDIQEQIKDLYDIDISSELVSKISEKIMPEVNEWQNRPLEEYYPFIFMDAIHYKIRDNHQIISKAAYVVLGVNADGYKDILGIWVGGNESSKFWVDAFNDGDVDMIISLYDNNATNHQVANEPVVGVAAIREMFANEFATAKMVCIVENIFEDGQWAILEWKDPLGLRGCGFFHVVNEKILFQRGYWDKLSFLKQHNLPVKE